MTPLPLLLLLAAPAQVAPQPGDWPCWRGAQRDGLSSGPGWSEVGETRWTVEVGLGHSSPSVVGGRVYVHGFDVERGVDVVRCLQTANAVELWRAEHAAPRMAQDHGGGTLTTPAVDGDRVFVCERDGRLACYDAWTGRVLWLKALAPLYGVEPGGYGFAASPVVLGERVIVAADRLFAFDAHDGELVWQTESLEAVYGTPTPFALDGAPCLAVLGQQSLDLVALDDGARLATFPWQKRPDVVAAASPIVAGERLFVSSAYDHGCALVEHAPLAGGELRAVWANRALRSKMAGGILIGEHVYGFDESMLVCLDLAGSVRWRVRGLGNGALSGGDGKLAVLSSRGELVIARATPERFEELSRAPLFEDGDCWTPPVIADGLVYCRNSLGTLVCRDHRTAAERAPVAATAESGGELPDAAALLARHRALVLGAGAPPESLRLTGTFEMSSQGYVPVPLVLDWLAPDRWSLTHGDSPPRRIRHQRVFDGELAFHHSPLGAELPDAAGQRMARDEALFFPVPDLAALHAEARTVARERFFERDCFRVEARTRHGTPRTLWFEVASGLLAGREAPDEPLVVYEDHRDLDGLVLPTEQRRFAPGTGIEERWRIRAVEKSHVDAEVWTRPEGLREGSQR